MKRTCLSTFMMWTWAALNGFGACTAPDSDASPSREPGSAAPAGRASSTTPSQMTPRTIRIAATKSVGGLRMVMLLLGPLGPESSSAAAGPWSRGGLGGPMVVLIGGGERVRPDLAVGRA